MRLDRLLANSGYGSRTTVKEMIRGGKVSVSGQIVMDSGFHVDDILKDSITVEGSAAKVHRYLHYVINKPAGVITALEDPRHRTVSEFIPDALKTVGLFPVGRLDIDTTGLILLTNDGTLCHRLASPKWHIPKTYYFRLSGKYLDDNDKISLAQGITLADGLKCKPARLEILSSDSGLLTITEGKYHQVKRMMKALGGTVEVLERKVMGPIHLDSDLLPGQIRALTDYEISELYKAVEME
ncbi:MAG: pseudouridine synthase [Saccharofermentanales bacterium]